MDKNFHLNPNKKDDQKDAPMVVAEEIEAKVVDKLRHSIAVDDVDKTTKVNKYQLSYSVDSLLSNPMNKRFQEGWEGKSLIEIFTHMTSTLSGEAMVKISNGTRTAELSVKDWKEHIEDNLARFDCSDKSKTQNVWIDVRGKSTSKEAVALSTL